VLVTQESEPGEYPASDAAYPRALSRGHQKKRQRASTPKNTLKMPIKMGWSCSSLADLPPQLPERGARTAHLTVSDFCREQLPGGPCTHWKALHRSKLLMQLHLPFSVRTAERLMAIARNPVLTKSDNLSLLLRVLGLFYLLSQVDVDRLEAKLADGTITSRLEAVEAAALRQNWLTAPSRPALRQLRQLLRVDRLEQPSAACPPARSSHVDVPGSRHLGSIRYTPHMPHCRRTGCVLNVLASKIQTWSHMASASRNNGEPVRSDDNPEVFNFDVAGFL
jgi:hypothetical protein